MARYNYFFKKEEWNLPGAVLEVTESVAKTGIFSTEAQIDQKDDYLKSPINYSVSIT
jgi:hypothetical protein